MSLPAAAARSVRQRLRVLWCRRLAGAALDRVGAALLLAAAALLAVGIYRFWEGEAPFDAGAASNLLGAALCGVAIYTLGSLPALDDAAGWIDRRAATHDRFHTALDFAVRPEPLTPMQALTLAECVRYVEAFPVRRWTPIRVPRTLGFVAVPLASLALLAWHASLGIGQAPRDPALDAAVAKRAAALQIIADRLHQEEQKNPSPELDKIAEAMKRSAERLRDSQRLADDQKLKTALGELSSLEAMLAAMKQGTRDEKISPGELAALAAALAASDPAKSAGEALKEGRLEQAGDRLQKLAEQMQAQGTGAQAIQQLAQAMQEQAAKLSEAEKNEVARQMEQAAQSAQNGQGQLSAQAMQRLAELLQQAGKNGAHGAGRQASSKPGASGGPMTQQQLQDLLNALENAKEGLQPGDGDGKAPGITRRWAGWWSIARVGGIVRRQERSQRRAGSAALRDAGRRARRGDQRSSAGRTRGGSSQGRRTLQTAGRHAGRRRILAGAGGRGVRSRAGGPSVPRSLRGDCTGRAEQRRTGEYSAGRAFFSCGGISRTSGRKIDGRLI